MQVPHQMTMRRRLWGWSLLAFFVGTYAVSALILTYTVFTGTTTVYEDCISIADRRDECVERETPKEVSNAGAAWFVSLPIAGFLLLGYARVLDGFGVLGQPNREDSAREP